MIWGFVFSFTVVSQNCAIEPIQDESVFFEPTERIRIREDVLLRDQILEPSIFYDEDSSFLSARASEVVEDIFQQQREFELSLLLKDFNYEVRRRARILITRAETVTCSNSEFFQFLLKSVYEVSIKDYANGLIRNLKVLYREIGSGVAKDFSVYFADQYLHSSKDSAFRDRFVNDEQLEWALSNFSFEDRFSAMLKDVGRHVLLSDPKRWYSEVRLSFNAAPLTEEAKFEMYFQSTLLWSVLVDPENKSFAINYFLAESDNGRESILRDGFLSKNYRVRDLSKALFIYEVSDGLMDLLLPFLEKSMPLGDFKNLVLQRKSQTPTSIVLITQWLSQGQAMGPSVYHAVKDWGDTSRFVLPILLKRHESEEAYRVLKDTAILKILSNPNLDKMLEDLSPELLEKALWILADHRESTLKSSIPLINLLTKDGSLAIFDVETEPKTTLAILTYISRHFKEFMSEERLVVKSKIQLIFSLRMDLRGQQTKKDMLKAILAEEPSWSDEFSSLLN